jgi:hypothetical protein
VELMNDEFFATIARPIIDKMTQLLRGEEKRSRRGTVVASAMF